jgi:hypothetical protein
MANKSYLNFKDELDDLENDQKPDSSLSDRKTLEAIGLDSLQGDQAEAQDEDELLDSDPDDLSEAPVSLPTSPRDAVMSAILNKRSPSEPLMDNFNQQEQTMNQVAQNKSKADLVTNLGQAFSSFAQGANAPKPTSLYDNMAKQNEAPVKMAQDALERKQKVIQAIEQRKSREAASNNTAQYRQQMIDLQKDRLKQAGAAKSQSDNTKQERLSSLNIGRTNTLMHDAPLNKETTKLNAANGVQTLIDSIKNGEITDSKNIRTQLTNMMAMIDLGAAGGESDRQSMGINNLYTKIKDLEAYVNSKPNKSIPSEYLNQLESEANAMGDRSAKNYYGMSKAILSGADLSGGNPDVNPGQVHQLVKQRMSTFLKEKGYDPETGERVTKKLNAQNEKAGVQTKVVNDVTYEKVPGGWQEVQ